MITILNTSILTDFGTYSYRPIPLEKAKKLVANGFQSAIGHQSTADIISTLLNIDCQPNRMLYRQKPGETALIFKLKGRFEEGKILSREEIEDIGYLWGVLKRKK